MINFESAISTLLRELIEEIRTTRRYLMVRDKQFNIEQLEKALMQNEFQKIKKDWDIQRAIANEKLSQELNAYLKDKYPALFNDQ